MSARLFAAAVALTAFSAGAVPFTLTISNNATTGPAWSTGLLTLQPLISVGLSPKADAGGPYFTYQFTNSNCNTACGRGCVDDGNAALLQTRWGLTSANSWVIPALGTGDTYTLTIDVPTGSKLSYVAWLNDTGVFDDFVMMHVPGDTSGVAVPMFSGTTPLDSVDFVISGYDSNSTSATDGSGDTCTNQCPAQQNGINCYVAPGNATYGTGGSLNTVTPGTAAVNFTGVSGNGQVRLAWTNTSPHAGTVIVRRTGAPVAFTPADGTTYTTGQNLGSNQTVAFSAAGADHARTDTGLSNGTRYFYKIFNYGSGRGYASGNVPTSSGIFSEPTPQTGVNPRWCYSFGMPSLQQPTTQLGAAVFTASNSGAMTASTTAPGTGTDGWELWRPVSLGAAVQVRASLVPLVGRTGSWLVTADQAGFAYLIDAATGAQAWKSADLGDVIQAQPVAQLNAYANAAFKAGAPNMDLIFVGTHNTSHTNNGVFALSSLNGSTVWSYAPTAGNNRLDWVTGLAVDYTNNRLYVASYGNGTQLTLRVLNSITGAVVSTFDPGGDLTMGVNLRAPHGTFTEVIASSSNGSVYGYSLPLDGGTPAALWSAAVGSAPTAYAFPLNDGFIASLTNGTLKRWTVTEPADGGTITNALKWSVNITNPTGVTLDYTNGWLYVGSTDGRLRQLNLDDGATLATVVVTDAGVVGMPTLDSSANRIHLGTADGRLCAFPNPLQ